MNTNSFAIATGRPTRFSQFFLFLIICLLAPRTADAKLVELTITGHWTEGEFKVIGPNDASYDSANPQFDGKVFGVAPSSGNVTMQLIVNTDGGVFFAKGSRFAADGDRAYVLAHDFFGYKDVKLVGDSFTFGTAAWRSDGILADLVGPDGQKASLWTDEDITKSDPSRISFRMFGRADRLSSDLFVGSRNNEAIGSEFLLWEYYKGEEIRSRKYTVKAKPISE